MSKTYKYVFHVKKHLKIQETIKTSRIHHLSSKTHSLKCQHFTWEIFYLVALLWNLFKIIFCSVNTQYFRNQFSPGDRFTEIFQPNGPA